MFEDRIAEMNKQPESVAPAIPYEKRVYTVDEIQDILGVSKTTTYQLIKSKVFHSVRVLFFKLITSYSTNSIQVKRRYTLNLSDAFPIRLFKDVPFCVMMLSVTCP